MKTKNLISVAALMLAVIFTSCEKDETYVKDLAGSWDATVTYSGGAEFPLDITVEQTANGSLNGSIGAMEMSGSLRESEFIMTYRDLQDNAITYHGSFNSEDKVSGSFFAEGAYLGTWTAIRNN